MPERLVHLRSSPLAFLPESFNNFGHLLATGHRIDRPPAETHAHFLMCTSHEEALQEQVAHVHTHKDTTVTATVLLGRVVQMHKPDRHVQEGSKFASHGIRFPDVSLV